MKTEKDVPRFRDNRTYAQKLKADTARLDAWLAFLHKPFRHHTPEQPVKLRRVWP